MRRQRLVETYWVELSCNRKDLYGGLYAGVSLYVKSIEEKRGVRNKDEVTGRGMTRGNRRGGKSNLIFYTETWGKYEWQLL